MAVAIHSLKVSLSEDDLELLQTFAAEQGISDVAQAVGPLLHEYMKVIDELWDEKFARTQDALDTLGDQVQAEYDAGLTETFDLDHDLLQDEIQD